MFISGYEKNGALYMRKENLGLWLGSGSVVATAYSSLVLRMSLISYALNADSDRYTGDKAVSLM